jgi:hypothetical protein
MFFANPVIALRNIRHALAPDGRLVMVVWRRRIDNDWICDQSWRRRRTRVGHLRRVGFYAAGSACARARRR